MNLFEFLLTRQKRTLDTYIAKNINLADTDVAKIIDLRDISLKMLVTN